MRAGRGWPVLAALLLAGACVSTTHDAFRLIHPPAAPDAAFPGGYRLLTKAPPGDWEVAARFASRDACEQAKRSATEDAVIRARARVGDAAKYDLDVRRAVNARCVRSVSPAAAERR